MVRPRGLAAGIPLVAVSHESLRRQGLVAVLGLAGWGWWLHAGHAEQENHLTKHDGEIATLQRDSDRIPAKLDEILRELKGRN